MEGLAGLFLRSHTGETVVYFEIFRFFASFPPPGSVSVCGSCLLACVASTAVDSSFAVSPLTATWFAYTITHEAKTLMLNLPLLVQSNNRYNIVLWMSKR